MKQCAACRQSKALEDFPIDRARRDGRYPYCRSCHSERERARRKITPEQAVRRRARAVQFRASNPTYARDQHLRRTFGMTMQEWDALFDAQGRRCALCRGADPKAKNWHTDHDHETGHVRGIVCRPCNHVLGLIEKGWQIPALEAVVHYLEGSRALVD